MLDRAISAVGALVVGAGRVATRKIERDGALARRFSPVTVGEPSVDDTVDILMGLRGAYEEQREEEEGTTRRSEARVVRVT